MKDLRIDNTNNAGTPFDFWEPAAGHEIRFRMRLDRRMRTPLRRQTDRSRWFVAAAAVFVAAMLWWSGLNKSSGLDAAVNEMAVAKNRLENVIRREIVQWNAGELPESKRLIQNTFKRLDRMQADFVRLRTELDRNGNSRILEAMIRNLRMQTQLLEDLQHQLEDLKKRKIDEKKVYQS